MGTIRARTTAFDFDLDTRDGETILEALRRRDRLDSTRAVAPLRIAPDARIITTDGNTFDHTVSAVVGAIEDAEARLEPARSPR